MSAIFDYGAIASFFVQSVQNGLADFNCFLLKKVITKVINVMLFLHINKFWMGVRKIFYYYFEIHF